MQIWCNLKNTDLKSAAVTVFLFSLSVAMRNLQINITGVIMDGMLQFPYFRTYMVTIAKVANNIA